MNSPADDVKLIEAFYEAAIFLKHKVEFEGWVWSSNFLREYVRCRHHLKFTNSKSPTVMDEVVRQHPDLGQWIKTKTHKGMASKSSLDDFLWA